MTPQCFPHSEGPPARNPGAMAGDQPSQLPDEADEPFNSARLIVRAMRDWWKDQDVDVSDMSDQDLIQASARYPDPKLRAQLQAHVQAATAKPRRG